MAEASVGKDFSVLPFLNTPCHLHPGARKLKCGLFPPRRGEELLAKIEPIAGTLPSL